MVVRPMFRRPISVLVAIVITWVAAFASASVANAATSPAPVVAASMSWSTTSIDVSTSVASVTVTVELPADVGGAAMYHVGGATFRSARSAQTVSDNSPTLGRGDGPISIFNFVVPRHAAAGAWTLDLAEVFASDGHHRSVTFPSGSPSALSVVSRTEDTQAPVVVSIGVDKPRVNTAYHTSTVRWEVRLSDRSAIASVDATVEAPDPWQNISVSLQREPDGAFTFVMGVSPNSKVGAHRLRLDHAADVLGNTVSSPTAPAGATSTITLFHANDVPAPPLANVSLSNARGTLEARWQAPTTDGGSPITGYEVTLLPERRTISVAAGVTSATLTGLGDNERHELEFVAINRTGRSQSSYPVEVWTWGVPNEPHQLAAVARRTVVDLTWRWTYGRSPAESFVVTAHPSGATTTVAYDPRVTTQKARFTDLDPRIEHTFTVAASNVVGTGPESSASAPVRLTATPAAPVLTGTVSASGAAGLRWTVPLGYDDLDMFEVCQSRPDGTVLSCRLDRNNAMTMADGRAGRTLAYSVRARGELGWGPRSNVLTLSLPSGDGQGFTPVAPKRMLDTRLGVGRVAGAVGAGQTVDLKVLGLPVGAKSATFNLTATGASAPTHVITHATGSPRPTASHLNVVPGQTVASLVTVPVSADGRVSLYNGQGRVHLIADLAGYTTKLGGSALVPQAGDRIVDTRSNIGTVRGKIGPGQSLLFTVHPMGGLDRPTAAIVNITATGATAATHLTAYPADEARPTASNVNVKAGETVANLAVVQLDESGQGFIANNAGSVHIIVDVVGAYTTDLGVGFAPVPPERVMDTRVGLGSATRVGSSPVSLTIKNVPVGARAVMLRATAVAPSRAGNLMTHSAAFTTTSSTLNFVASQTVGNSTVVPIGPDGIIRFSASAGVQTHLVVDVAGFYLR